MHVLDRLSAVINRVALAAAVLLAVLMIACLCTEVFFRYALNHSLPWSEEVALLLFTWVVMLFGSIGVREGFHVRVSVIVDLLPPTVRLWLDRVILVGIAAFAVVIVDSGWDMVVRNLDQVAPATRYPLPLLYGAVPMMGALIVLHAAARLFQPSAVVEEGAGDLE